MSPRFPVYWHSCRCPYPEGGEACQRFVYDRFKSCCEVCEIGCGHIQLITPSLNPVAVTTILSHVKMDQYPPDPPMVPFYRKD